jgi:hypothetical protein
MTAQGRSGYCFRGNSGLDLVSPSAKDKEDDEKGVTCASCNLPARITLKPG